MSDEKEKIIEEYLGVHPKYFKYKANSITLDIAQMDVDGIQTHPDAVRNWEKGELYKEHLAAGRIALNP